MNYVSPVEGTKEVLLEEEPEVANNKLIFPPRVVHQEVLDPALAGPEEEQNINKAFNAVLNG